jgi:fatty-acyl-CoA synthase
LGNQPEWVIMAMGAACIGAVFVPFNTWHKRTEIEWTLRHCDISVSSASHAISSMTARRSGLFRS